MHATFLAPLLSATSRTVCIWITAYASAFWPGCCSADSMISATRHRFSSWALYFFLSVKYLPYLPCFMRRSTTTTTVLVILLERTVPMRLLGIERDFSCCCVVFSDMGPLLRLGLGSGGLLGLGRLLRQHRHDSRQV